MTSNGTLVVGAVSYDPKVVDIWEGFKAWFGNNGLSLDYVLYSNYERLVESLIDGHVDVAWNSPLAWVRARRLGAAAEVSVRAIAMRDTDFDVLGGKHGDHVGGERDAALALAAGEVDAACLLNGNRKLFESEGLFGNGGVVVVASTEPFDHCNFTVTSAAPKDPV